MNDLKIFLLEILAFTRKTSRSPESILTSISITALVFSLTVVVLLAAPIFMTNELALLFIYGLAVFETILGLRVGFLRIRSTQNEHYLSMSNRFWKRSFPYVFPALIIPIPISFAVTNFLATSVAGWWLILFSIITSYMMFFFIGVTWSVLTRVMSKRTLPRVIILILSTTAVLATLSSGDFVFRNIFLNQSYNDYMQLLVVLAQLSTTAFLVIVADLALKHLPISTKNIGQFWPIFLNSKSQGQGQGSSTFFSINKFFVRSTVLHRRISGLIISLVMFLLIVYAVLYVGGSQVDETIVLVSILLFTAVSALLVSRPSAQLAYRKTQELSYLPVDKKKILAGAWLAGAAWQIGVTAIYFGIVITWININSTILYPILVGAVSQHTLIFGWTEKLDNAHHHNLSLFAVFSLAVLVGLLPILLLPVAGLLQTILIQLIWLGFIGILLHTTARERIVKYA